MSERRFRRVDRRTAEQLLRGAPDPAQDSLSSLLAAASAPAREDELAGEQAAVAAFRAARLADSPQPRRPSMLKVTLAKLLTVKIAAAAVTAVAVGGVAVAAVTGNFSGEPGDNPADTSTISELSATQPATSIGEGTSAPKDKDTGNKPTDKPGNSEKPNGDNKDNGGGKDNASPSPSLQGLCKAYFAGEKAEHGKALDNPAFTVLITTAGGKDKVPAYCADLLGEQHGQPDHPTGKPTEPHPTGKPNGTPPSTRPNR